VAAAVNAAVDEARIATESERSTWRTFVHECIVDAVLVHVYETALKACMERWAAGDALVDELIFHMQDAVPGDFNVCPKFRLDGAEAVDARGKILEQWRAVWRDFLETAKDAPAPATLDHLPPRPPLPIIHAEERKRRAGVAAQSYGRAAGLFRTLLLQRTPRQKCNIVARALQAMCDAPAAYYRGRIPPDKAAVGADDLVDVFAFVVVSSRTASLISQLGFIETFLPARLRIGSDGFALTTLHTATSILRARADIACSLHVYGHERLWCEQKARSAVPLPILRLAQPADATQEP
jgi:hypothetical protein